MERSNHWIAAVGLLALIGTPTAQQQQESTVACTATNARLNLNRDLKSGADYVPVVADDSLGFHVVYSIKADNSFTVGIYILPLEGNDLLIFGAGYAENSLEGEVYEAEAVDRVIRGCMGKDPSTSNIHFVTPHGHLDHINPSFIEELETLGYSFAQIAYHEDDAFWIDFMDWRSEHMNLFKEWRGSVCGDNLAQFDSPLGKIWFTPRPGHTDGSIDLIIDIENDPTNRFMIRGSMAGGECPPVPGIQIGLDAHGTVFLPPYEGAIRARAEIVNGGGANRLCLMTDAGPRIGGKWQAMVEAQGHAGANGILLMAYSAGLDAGPLTPFGEFFMDTATGYSVLHLVQPAFQSTFNIDVPSDMNYLGYEAWFQALIVGGASPELCNALHVQIGF